MIYGIPSWNKMSETNTKKKTANLLGENSSVGFCENKENPSDVEGKVKNRLLSIWNNVKYGMQLKPNFSSVSPVWLLGKCYRRSEGSKLELGTDVAAVQSDCQINCPVDDGFDGFKYDFVSRLWMTYRREFPILNGSTYSSDCGWGCMLRSGQMLLAQALVCHFLGRDWRWKGELQCQTEDDRLKEINHRKIIKWFGDKPSRNSPFSIHALVNLGENSGRKAGDWYGPGFVAHLLRQAVGKSSQDNYEFDSLCIYVAQDCSVYIDDVLNLCTTDSNDWKSVILLIPIRLGTDKFNLNYTSSFSLLFSYKQCIGVIGGRPKHSLYFVGCQDDKLIYMDPHYCQEVVNVWSPSFDLDSFHCRSPRKIHISKIDPSCCIGFYCSTKDDFFNLIEMVQSMPHATTDSHGEYPMFIFVKGRSCDVQISPKTTRPLVFNLSVDATFDDENTETGTFEII